ncbi:MAG: TonB family protein [Vicinamibacterales bacterium]
MSEVLRSRTDEPGGLQGMVAVSILVHGLLLAVVLFAPQRWFTREPEAPRTVMTITLEGGGEGPRNGGLTPIGGRPVQVQAPPEPPKRSEPVQRPAASTVEMPLPSPPPKAKTTTPPPAPVTQAPSEARGETPTKGEEPVAGSAPAVTSARGQGFGLSSGGGPGSGSALDVTDFCCPDYLTVMIERIKANWNQRQGVAGQAMVKFTIQRDGQIRSGDVELETSSGYTTLDQAAQRAILFTRQLPPLPAAFPNQTLTVHLNFQYQQ